MARTTTLLFLTLFILCPTLQFSSSLPSYSDHCNLIVPESTQSDSRSFPSPPPSQFLLLTNAHVRNADQILHPSPQFSADFFPDKISQARSPGIFNINATLRVKAGASIPSSPPNFVNRRFRVYGGTRYLPRSITSYWLSGLWSSSSGQLCMVGSVMNLSRSGHSDSRFGVVFKMNYPMNSTIMSSLVTGTLESLSLEGSSGHFRPIHVTGLAMMNYEYDLVKGETRNECGKENNSSRTLDPNSSCLNVIGMADAFELDYERSCGGINCGRRIDGLWGRFMSMNMIDCSDKQTMRVMFRFSNTSRVYNGYRQPFIPSRVLVAEGSWNSDRSGICFIGCRILGSEDSTVNASIGDCTYQLSFGFPAVLSIRSRSVIDGQIWSNRSVNEEGYVDRVGIKAFGFRPMTIRDVRYKYTEIERAGKYCTRKVVRDGKDHRGSYISDMAFDIEVKNNKGQGAFGHASPLFVDGRLWRDELSFLVTTMKTKPSQANQTQMQFLNVSYEFSFNPTSEFKLGRQSFLNKDMSISSEGILDPRTGLLCMVGCQKTVNGNETLDCKIFIRIQFPAPNSNKGEFIKGTIGSKREKTDPLYFEQLELSAVSLLNRQAAASIWRMDLEIIMVLISNTFMCIFVVLQLLHVKKHPAALPLISFVMLTALTLGHMIPLLLNFDAFLSNRSRRGVLLGKDAWVEVDEVLVRVITMIAFLLECRLLQLTWLSRASDENQKGLWVAEKKVVSWSLPLLIGGALIAWLLHPWRSSSQSGFLHRAAIRRQTFSLWGDLKSYAGFFLDCFLLPQIMFNVFSDAKEKALSPPYYCGITMVRLMPHLYDLFRAHTTVLKLDLWYIYANPSLNYYSTGWDIVISCCGLVFVVVVFLQQRYGGRWILPRRLKERFAYEKVPITSSG